MLIQCRCPLKEKGETVKVKDLSYFEQRILLGKDWREKVKCKFALDSYIKLSDLSEIYNP